MMNLELLKSIKNFIITGCLAGALLMLAPSMKAEIWTDLRNQGTEIAFPKPIAEIEPEIEWSEEAWVSWYGRRFHGRRTASGERFNQYDLTCASRTLPFGTLIEVKNLRNGKTVQVKVNDRGPFNRHRTLDLSRGAAVDLGFLNQGVTKVVYRIVYLPE